MFKSEILKKKNHKPINILHEFLEHMLYIRGEIPPKKIDRVHKSVPQTPSRARPPHP